MFHFISDIVSSFLLSITYLFGSSSKFPFLVYAKLGLINIVVCIVIYVISVFLCSLYDFSCVIVMYQNLKYSYFSQYILGKLNALNVYYSLC